MEIIKIFKILCQRTVSKSEDDPQNKKIYLQITSDKVVLPKINKELLKIYEQKNPNM